MGLAVGGLATGIDTDKMISQLMDLERQPIVTLQKREAAYQVQLTAYGMMQSSLSTLQTATDSLKNRDSLMTLRGASINTAILNASASSTAHAGTYSVSIQQRAAEHKLKSAGLTQGEHVGATAGGDVGGVLKVQVGSATAVSITVQATDDLNTLATAINDKVSGVTASVIFDGTKEYLTLASQQTGTANGITITALEDGTTDVTDAANVDNEGLSRLINARLTETQGAKNALLTVDGVANVSRSSNTISDVIQGVTLSLNADTGNTAVVVSKDSSSATKAVQSFVDSYNKLVDFFSAHQKYDFKTQVAGDLLGDATTNSVRGQLRQMLSAKVSGAGTYSQISELGVKLNSEGKLQLDSTKLNDAVANHLDDVIKFFGIDETGATGAKGFGVKFSTSLTSMLDAKKGILAARTIGINKSVASLQKKAVQIDLHAQKTEEILRSQFNHLESVIARYTATGNQLTQQLQGLDNLSQAISRR